MKRHEAHLQDSLERVQVAALTLHNGAKDEASDNLKQSHLTSHILNYLFITDFQHSTGRLVSKKYKLSIKTISTYIHSYPHTHLLTAEPLWHGAELWWRVFYLTHRHIHVTCIVLSFTWKINNKHFIHKQEQTGSTGTVPAALIATHLLFSYLYIYCHFFYMQHLRSLQHM